MGGRWCKSTKLWICNLSHYSCLESHIEDRIYTVILLYSFKYFNAVSAFTPSPKPNPSKYFSPRFFASLPWVYQIIPVWRSLVLNTLSFDLHYKKLEKYSFSQQKSYRAGTIQPYSKIKAIRFAWHDSFFSGPAVYSLLMLDAAFWYPPLSPAVSAADDNPRRGGFVVIPRWTVFLPLREAVG